MSIEETIGAVLKAELMPLREQLRRLTEQIDRLRRAMPPALVTVSEAAKILGVSIPTVRRQVRDGTLPSKRVGRSLRVDLAALHGPTEAEVIQLADRLAHVS